MSDVLEAAPDFAEALLLDPFGSHPHWASGIPGLGGQEPAPDPSYVFLTLDSRPAIGRVRATVRLHDLCATRGTLLIEIRVRSAFPGADPSRLRTVSLDLADLARSGGVAEVEFESFRNAFYAIAGSINDATDATASHVSVSIDRRATEEEHGKAWGWRSASLAADRPRPNADSAMIGRLLTDLALPSLGEPVSQVGSPSQCRETAFAEAMGILRRAPTPSFGNWSLAYVLRAITRFAGDVDAATVLGFITEGTDAALVSHFARTSEIMAMRHAPPAAGPALDPGAELKRLWLPELCDEASFFSHAHFTAGDIRLPPVSLRDQFDVVWSIGANRAMTRREFVNFAVNGLSSAKPGGFAVHVFDYVEDVAARDGTALTRHDIERLATMALSHGNEVAHLRFRHDSTPAPGSVLPFGIVLRRGGLPTA